MGNKPNIVIALAAMGSDPGDVDFGTYLHALNAFKKYFTAVGSDFDGEDIDWIVKDLHHSEPTIVLEARNSQGGSKAQSVAGLAVKSLNLMANGKDAPDLNNDAINAVKDLLTDVGKKLAAARVESGSLRQDIDIQFNHAFKAVKFTNEVFHEDWEGMLEEINLHQNKKTFRLYPAAGPKYITCEFKADLVPTIKGMLERKVSVTGDAKYRPNSKYPHRIIAGDVVVLDDIEGDLALSEYNPDGFSEDVKRLKNLRDGWLG